uniref:Acyl_transf_3 domain-containing protein n=1 Tax=Meloidogyne hapla TaxID=6305 RepID=A0A1I8BER4_MELHA
MNQRFKNGLNYKIEQEKQEKQQNSFKNQQQTSTPSKTSHPPLKTSTPLFNYPPLPKWEIRLCWLVTFGTVAYAWFCVWLASSKWEFKIGKSQASISNLLFFGIKIKDESNWEWFRWSPFATSQYLPLLVGHSILFNFLPVFFPEKIWNKIYLFASMAGSARTFIVWLSALPILYVVMNHTDWIHNDVFLVLLFISYTLLSYISFCLELVKQQGKQEEKSEKQEEKPEHQQNIQENKQQNRPEQEEKHEKHGEKQPKMPEKQPNKRQFPPAKQQEKYQNNQQNIQKQPEKHLLNNSKHPIYLLERMLFYTFYQPFLFSLIVLYPEFERQYAYRNAKQRDWIKIIFKCFRVAFWWAVCELCLHFVYFGSIALDTEFMQKLPKDQFVSIGMAIGRIY